MRKNISKNNNYGPLSRNIYGIVLIFLMIIFSSSLARNVSKIRSFNKKIQEKEQKVRAIERENEEIKRRLEEVKTNEYIEKQLRDKLGLAKEGEIIVVLPDENTLRSFAPKFDEEKETLPDPIWKKWFKLFDIGL